MAVVRYKDLRSAHSYAICVWEDLHKGDEGFPFENFADGGPTGYARFNVHVTGEFDGAELQMLGSIIPGKFDTMGFSGYADFQQLQGVAALKPVVVGGGELTKLSVGLIASR